MDSLEDLYTLVGNLLAQGFDEDEIRGVVENALDPEDDDG